MNDLWVFIVAVSVLFVMLTAFIISFTLFFIKRRKEHRDEKVTLEANYKETLLKSRLEMQEQTLKSVSQELHDNLGQVASLIKINLNLISMDEPSDISPRLEETKELTRQLISDLKSVSANLNGTLIAKIGLDKGIENEINRLRRLGTLEVSYSGPEISPSLKEQKTIILLRMFQETLNNTLKHSKTEKITIDLKDNTESLVLIIQDYGIGFDLDKSKAKGGSGLYNLQNRASLIQATLNIESTLNQGTKTTIEVSKDI